MVNLERMEFKPHFEVENHSLKFVQHHIKSAPLMWKKYLQKKKSHFILFLEENLPQQEDNFCFSSTRSETKFHWREMKTFFCCLMMLESTLNPPM